MGSCERTLPVPKKSFIDLYIRSLPIENFDEKGLIIIHLSICNNTIVNFVYKITVTNEYFKGKLKPTLYLVNLF